MRLVLVTSGPTGDVAPNTALAPHEPHAPPTRAGAAADPPARAGVL